ncbi:interferon-induced protein 44-like [Electrophorus electricus]|uniref:interferon-induced protein 44-like n=1 Tax=Electrophorus electricus TaxID=8005 RepID=UPI0015D0BDBA|nr:interferon-induced protein 44-like [Electrophorus electricus]
MGSKPSKPQFITVLGDKQVEMGKEIILSCETNTEGLTVTWEKDGHTLKCVQDKHVMKQDGNNWSLQILNADEVDEGNYTIKLENQSGRDACSAKVIVELKEWRTVQWKQNEMVDYLRTFTIDIDEVKELRFLLYGLVGAGKSSTINTIKTIFGGSQFVNCLAEAMSTTSFTMKYEKYVIADGKEDLLPLAFNDTVGVEKEQGVHTDDIISALRGHIKEGYVFNPKSQISEENPHYLKNPSLSDRIHCLVSVVAADRIAVMDQEIINKMRQVRQAANRMGIPQVVFMTRVDLACPLTKENLRYIYKSKKVRDNMQKCSSLLGIPVNCIFPVKNYHMETHVSGDINCLMLDALTQIVDWANDYVAQIAQI